MGRLKTFAEIMVSSCLFVIICTGTTFLQGILMFPTIDKGYFGFYHNNYLGSLLISIVTPTSAVIGPILYFGLLKKILTLNSLALLIVIHFVVSGTVLYLLQYLDLVGFALMFFTPAVTIITCIAFRIVMEEYSGEYK